MQTISQSNIALHRAQLIEAARRGEATGLVEYVYSCLPGQAVKLTLMFRETCGARLEVEDLIQAGIEYVLRRLDRALQATNPVGYLIHAAKYAMLHYCQEQRGPIRVPCTSQWRGEEVPVVVSLDAPLNGYEDLALLDVLSEVV